jgi:hypothetical protein
VFTIDYALRIYTDKVNTGEEINIDHFKDNLSTVAFKEFQELILYINLLKSASKDMQQGCRK